MIAKHSTIPTESLLIENMELYGYIDSYRTEPVMNGQTIDLNKFVKLFLYSSPKWVDTLMALRDKIVKLFGLKTSDRLTENERHPDINDLKPGQQLGIFKLFALAENEVILGEDDKHLNFRVSILLQPPTDNRAETRLSITTAVKFNNLFGKLYFLPVKPFHQLIVYSAMKNIVKQLEGGEK
jgi:hypothetical protein